LQSVGAVPVSAQARDGSHRHGLPVRRRDVRYGSKRKSRRAILTSVLPSTTDIRQRDGHVRKSARLGLRKVSFEQLEDWVKLEQGGQGVQDPAAPDNGKVRSLFDVFDHPGWREYVAALDHIGRGCRFSH
jgi:hypothetical protein